MLSVMFWHIKLLDRAVLINWGDYCCIKKYSTGEVMYNTIKTLTISVVAFAGMIGISTQVIAGCTQGTGSDENGNTCIGSYSLNQNSGNANTANGAGALYSNTTGYYNTASGYLTLYTNTTGYSNTASGLNALRLNTTGYSNTAYGVEALYRNTTGGNNTALGYLAGNNLTTGSYNIAIAAPGVADETKTIRIGVQNTQKKTIIAGIYGTTVTGTAVVVNSKGQLGVASSSRRYKEDIQPMGDVSDRLMGLRPVTFRYKQADEAGNKPVQYGLIAEEVDGVMPELVVRNADGSPETVAYHVLPSLLLNAYQKQQQELAATKEKLAATQIKLSTHDETLASEHSALLDAQSQIIAMQEEMSRMRDSVDRLMAAITPSTKLASAE
jgi:hypothetical protein